VFPETPAASPVRRFELVTNDVDRAHQALRETYCDHEVRLRGDPEHLAYRQLTVAAGPLAADQIEHSMNVAVTADPSDGITVAATARRWGWANPSHFAAAYLKADGRHPRHTLRA
jgi:hypothetical protein